ncbi:hypothetical protein GCM10018772_59710 [Streptomyces fumanus]|uniref:Uncharacterized protein n=1 Tax=Streptomyces fumanus TaxID=67302 RepID=A0A919E9F6_9ACTN|nr:hypothetical protein GCM10018772_59710 [Streptomyces fumanus]
MVELPGEAAVGVAEVAEDLPLPQRVVRVLHRQRLPPRGLTPHPGRVGRAQVTGEYAHGHAVDRDVVRDEHQHRLRG